LAYPVIPLGICGELELVFLDIFLGGRRGPNFFYANRLSELDIFSFLF